MLRRLVVSLAAVAISVPVLLVSSSCASSQQVAPAVLPAAQSTAAPRQIEFVAAIPRFSEWVRPETTAEASMGMRVDDVIGSDEDVFAGGAWIGGQPLRMVYVKVGAVDAARARFDHAQVPTAEYQLVEVPKSFNELESALKAAAAALQRHGIPYTSIAPIPETGQLAMTAAAGSRLVLALDPSTAAEHSTGSIADLLDQLAKLGVRWVAVQEVGSGDSG